MKNQEEKEKESTVHTIPHNSPKEEQKQESVQQPNELEELKDLLLRTQANFENYRKQMEKRVEEMKLVAGKNIILQLLPVLDNFELVLHNVDTTTVPQDFLKGIELMYAELNGLLEENGVQPIITEKQKFDPYNHEALMKVDSELPENVIIEEFQRGYFLHDRVLRPAMVRVRVDESDGATANGDRKES